MNEKERDSSLEKKLVASGFTEREIKKCMKLVYNLYKYSKKRIWQCKTKEENLVFEIQKKNRGERKIWTKEENLIFEILLTD